MANVSRFFFPGARSAGTDVFVAGVGMFRGGVLDVPSSDSTTLAAVRAVLTPLGGQEQTNVDTSVAPAPPGTRDPYPEYLKQDEGDARYALRGEGGRSPSLMRTAYPAIADAATPADLPGLAVWLKADALTLADGAKVASWTDSSGKGRHAVQATVDAQPVLKKNVLNGKPVVRFASASLQHFEAPYGGEPGTIFVVGKQTTPNVWASFCGARASDTGFSDAWFLRAQRPAQRDVTTPGQPGYAEFCRSDYRDNASATPQLTARMPQDVDKFDLFMGTLDAGTRTLSFYRDGYAQRVTTPSALGNIQPRMLVGAAWSYAQVQEFLNGDIAEIIIFARALTRDELDLVGDYLAAKYAMPYTHVIPPAEVDMPLIMSTFSYDSPNMLHLLASADGINWQHINGGVPSYTAPGQRLHDPSIRRASDGTFWVAYTRASSGSVGFDLCKSRDLTTWEFVGTIDLSAKISGITNAWAPEWFCDPTTGLTHILINVSTNNAQLFQPHEMHLTDDTGIDFTNPVMITGTGPDDGAYIDAFIFWDGAYFMFLKGAWPDRYSSSSLTSGYTAAGTGNWGNWSAPNGNGYEGPSLFKFDGKWHLLADDGKLKVSTTSQIRANPPWTDFVPITITPASVPRMNHGTVINI